MPEGKLYRDEYFGDMHIYRDTAEIRLPIAARSPGIDSIALAIKSQGCADAGLCYPPQVWVTNVSLPAGGATAAGSRAAGSARCSAQPRPATAAGRRTSPCPSSRPSATGRNSRTPSP